MIIKISYIYNLFLIVVVLKCNKISNQRMLVHPDIMRQFPFSLSVLTFLPIACLIGKMPFYLFPFSDVLTAL
jgi:hypothetical protein